MSAPRLPGNAASLIASGLHRLMREANELHEDVDAWRAPSECHDDVRRQCERAEVEFWRHWRRRTHLSERELLKLVRSRITPKSAYNLGL